MHWSVVMGSVAWWAVLVVLVLSREVILVVAWVWTPLVFALLALAADWVAERRRGAGR